MFGKKRVGLWDTLLGLWAIWCPGHWLTLNERFASWFISQDSQNGHPASKSSDSRALTLGMNLGPLFKEDQGIINLRADCSLAVLNLQRSVHNIPLLTKNKGKIQRWSFSNFADRYKAMTFLTDLCSTQKLVQNLVWGYQNKFFLDLFMTGSVKNHSWRTLQRWFVYKNIPLMIYSYRNRNLLKTHTFPTLWC